MYLNMSSVKWRPFRISFDVLKAILPMPSRERSNHEVNGLINHTIPLRTDYITTTKYKETMCIFHRAYGTSVYVCKDLSHCVCTVVTRSANFQIILRLLKLLRYVNTLRPRQNGRHFADDPFKRIFLNENVYIYKFRLRFHWSLFPRVQSTIFQHWFR